MYTSEVKIIQYDRIEYSHNRTYDDKVKQDKYNKIAVLGAGEQEEIENLPYGFMVLKFNLAMNKEVSRTLCVRPNTR